MDREGGNRQRMRKSWEWSSLSIFSFSHHFLFISSFSLHFLAAWLQGCSGLWHPENCEKVQKCKYSKIWNTVNVSSWLFPRRHRLLTSHQTTCREILLTPMRPVSHSSATFYKQQPNSLAALIKLTFSLILTLRLSMYDNNDLAAWSSDADRRTKLCFRICHLTVAVDWIIGKTSDRSVEKQNRW